MAVKITITKKMEGQLRLLAEDEAPGSSLARQLIASVEDARLRGTGVKGINPYDVVRTIRSVLGSSAILPPSFDRTPGPLLSLIKRRTMFLGLTLEDVERAAIRAKHSERLPISVEWLIKIFDRLLAPEEERGTEAVTRFVERGEE